MKVKDLLQANNNGAIAKLKGVDALQVGLARLKKLDDFLEFAEDTIRRLEKTQNGLLRAYGRTVDYKDSDGAPQRRQWVPPEKQEEYGERIEELLTESVEMSEPVEAILSLGDFYDDDTPEESYKLTTDQARILLRLGLLKGEDDGGKKPTRRKSANAK